MGVLKVNFESVKEYSSNLISISDEMTKNLKVPSGMAIVSVGLVPSYFTDFESFVTKHATFLSDLGKVVEDYHNQLVEIEDSNTVKANEVNEKEAKEKDSGKASREGGTSTSKHPGEPEPPKEIIIPPELIVELGFDALPPNASMNEILAKIAEIAGKFGLTLPQLFSGEYNYVISQLIGYSPNTAVAMAILAQLDESVLQAYLNGLLNDSGSPQMIVPIKKFLQYMAAFLNLDLSLLMTDPNYALSIKIALQNHRASVITLNNISQETALEIQAKLKDMIFGDGKGNYNKHDVDDITINMLKDYLSSVASKNNISLEELLGDEKHSELVKQALQQFLSFVLYGKLKGLEFAGIDESSSSFAPGKEPEKERIDIPESEFKNSDYSVLPPDANTDQVNSSIQAILDKYGLTLEELYSGEYNDILTKLLNNSSHSTTFIVTANQLSDLNLQTYLNDLNAANSVPKHFVSVESYLSYLAENQNVSLDELLSDPKYAELIKTSLYEYRESLISLNNLSENDSISIQQSINEFLLLNDKSNYNIDPSTENMLTEFLKSVADKNNISLEEMLTQEKYAELTKESLNEFMKFALNGDESDLPVANLIEDLTNIANENDINPEDILNGENNDILTDYINNSDNDNEVSEVINNLDENDLQNYVNEIVNEDKHPEVVNNPVIKEVIKVIEVNKNYIKGDTSEIVVTSPEDTENQEYNFEQLEKTEEVEILDEAPKEEMKEILTNEIYAPKLKEVVQKNNSFNWAGLFPLAGLGLIPLIAILRKKRNEDPNRESYIFSSDEAKPLIDQNFKYFAESNIVTEESLLDGSNFELLSIYLSQLDSLSAVLMVFSAMKDENLQKYLLELYNLKFEHVWSSKSLILKILFNELSNVAFKQGIDINTLLSNSNYVVWVKTAIVDIMNAYSKYENDINSNGGFKLFINNILGKSILINDKNYNILKNYLDLSAKKLNLDFEAFLSQLSEFDNKLIIFAIIRYGEGNKNYRFGFTDSIVDQSDSQSGGFVAKETGKEVIFDQSGYNALLFNSSIEQIEKALTSIAKHYNLNLQDLYLEENENIFNILIAKSTNLILTLYLLCNLDQDRLQKYIHAAFTKSSDNKFITIILKYLEFLAKSENTTLNALLTKPEYSKLIKKSLEDFKESLLKLVALSKKDGAVLNEDMNNLFFLEDISQYGIDKITIELIKGMLSNLGKNKNIGLNALLDIKNIAILKELMEKIVTTLIFVKDAQNDDSKEEKVLVPVKSEVVDNTSKSFLKGDKLADFAMINNIDVKVITEGKDFNLLNKYFSEANNINEILVILMGLDEITLQKYLNEVYKNKTDNKFLNYILMLVQVYAKSESTTIEYVLSNAVYASKLKILLSDFMKSLENFEMLSKIEAIELSKELNNLLNIDDSTPFGIDKITITMIKDLLSSSTKTDNIDLNSLLDPKNANVLKKLLQKILKDIMTSSIVVEKKIDISNKDMNKDEIVNLLRVSFSNPDYKNSLLLNKIKKYFEIMISDSGIPFEEYIFGQEFSNFIKINFENNKIMSFIYEYMNSNIDYSFDVTKKITDLVVKSNITYDELKSKGGINFVVQSIIKENNIIYSLELLVDFEKENLSDVLLNLNSIKENTNIVNLFDYIDRNLKKPNSLLLEDYIKENKKDLLLFLLKVLLILLILLLISNKEDKEV